MSDSLTASEILAFRELVKIKRENPEEYKQLWEDIKEIVKDMMVVMKELVEEME